MQYVGWPGHQRARMHACHLPRSSMDAWVGGGILPPSHLNGRQRVVQGDIDNHPAVSVLAPCIRMYQRKVAWTYARCSSQDKACTHEHAWREQDVL